MQYEIWKKWYQEAMLKGDAKNLKRLRKIGIMHGWIKEENTRKKKISIKAWYFRKD